MIKSAQAGRKGPSVRSDCWIKISLAESGGIKLGTNSKVKELFGTSIEKLINEGLEYFNIKHAEVEVEDFGALPFVIMARMECVIRIENGCRNSVVIVSMKRTENGFAGHDFIYRVMNLSS